MDIILIPGLWLDAGSWDQVVPVLEAEGHRALPLTLPGMESPAADRSVVSLRDHVAAVVTAIDACDEGPVMLVAHSAGGALAHAAVDARPERVARAMYVGGFPVASGEHIADGFAVSESDIPFPDWESFEAADLRDLDEAARADFRARAIPAPARLATDRQVLSDDRRHQVPVSLVCPEYTSEMLQGWVEAGYGSVSELAAIRHVEYVDLPTGHWPQFTRPVDLGRCIVERAYVSHVDEHGRIHPPVAAGETLTALGFLDYQRATLAWKTAGLGEEGLRATAADSTMTLGGLLKHMAWVEDYWFSRTLHDRAPSSPWDGVDWSADQDWEFTSSLADTPEELRGLWRTAVARSRALVAAAIPEAGLDSRAARPGPEGESVSLRWIVLHMIEEYARHNGHADLLRESVDGQTGE